LIVFQGDAPFVFEGTYDEFLDSIGWEGEESAQPSKGKKKKSKSAMNGDGKGDSAKRDKAQVMQERSRLVTPLRERVASLEKSVAQLEGVIALSQQALTQASTKGDGASIQRLSQELAQNKREVEQQMLKWEAAQAELETLEKSYEERLAAFAN
jgi:ATP-binding cassette subfamily F protein 3